MSKEESRLNKVLAQHGYGSRRAADAIIEAGRVTVNGQPATMGQKVTDSDIVAVDAKPITNHTTGKIVLAFNKPRGVTTTKKDPFAKVTVMDYLPPELQHLNPVGRLDRDSHGLLLLTNDGDLAAKLTHPRYEHEKEYEVTLSAMYTVSPDTFVRDINKAQKCIVSPGHQTKPLRILTQTYDAKQQTGFVTVVISEGKKRQIRHVFQDLGYFVTDLKRTRIANITLADLPEGRYRTIDPSRIRL